MDALLAGFALVLTPANLLYCFIGAFLGTVVGILPGLGPLTTIAILLPITFKMDVTSAIIMLSGIYYGVAYGGTVTSVLMRIPGEASSVVTCLDGYEMARKGRAGAALFIAGVGSFVAGTLGVVAITLLSPPLSRLVLAFGPAEYAMLMLAGLAMVTYMSSGSLPRALLMAALGLLLGTVGSDPMNMTPRLTFGILTLGDGINLVPLAIGLFGLSEVLFMARASDEAMKAINPPRGMRAFLPTRDEARRSVGPIGRGTVLGFLVGLLPGGGAVIASFLSYGIERRLSRRPDEFGKGAVEGLAGPEAANNAGTQTSSIPMLTLGIPTNSVMALMIAAMMIHSIQPGPQVMTSNPTLFWGLIVSMWVGNLMLVILNLPLIGLWIKLLQVPYRLLYPAILLFCCIGAYSLNNNPWDVLMTIPFAILGYYFKKWHCEPAPLLMGFVLGEMMEEYLRRALTISRGDWTVFIDRPLSATLLGIAVLLLVIVALPFIRKKRDEAFQGED